MKTLRGWLVIEDWRLDFYVAIWGLRMDGPGWARGDQARKPSTRPARDQELTPHAAPTALWISAIMSPSTCRGFR